MVKGELASNSKLNFGENYSPIRLSSPEKEKKEQLLNNKPYRGLITFTTIQPSNTYKKQILNQVAGKYLNCHNCNFMNSYYVVIKYNLFDCKSAISMKLLLEQD